MEGNMQKSLMTIEVFLAEYSMSRSKFYQHVRNKKIRITKDGARTYVAREDANDFLKKLREDSPI